MSYVDPVTGAVTTYQSTTATTSTEDGGEFVEVLGTSLDESEETSSGQYTVRGLEEFLAAKGIDLSSATMHQDGVRYWGGEALPQAAAIWQGGTFALEGLTTGEVEQVGGDIFQFHNAKFVQKDDTIHAYFIDHSQGQFNVGLATSTDGADWEYQGTVLQRGEDYDSAIASFPTVSYDEASGQWTMLYQGQDEAGADTICLATSEDGLSWDKQGPIIEPGDAGWVSAVDVGTPTLYNDNGAWHVYFHALAEDGRVRIGHASGEDLTELTVDEGAVLDVDASGAETQTVGNRSNIFQSGDYYYMVYEASANDTYAAGSAQWSLNLARAESLDGPWEKLSDGPLISNPEAGFGYDGPEVLQTNGETWVYFRGEGNTTWRFQLEGLAGEAAAEAESAESGESGEAGESEQAA